MCEEGLRKVVSGGQSGVDRAALDWASEAGLESGGWCPRRRQAEDGTISPRYPLRETPSPDPAQRTEWNVRDSDATLLLTLGAARSKGTDLTLEMALLYGRPHLCQDLDDHAAAETIRDWLKSNPVQTLNVAGPRESEAPGIYVRTRDLLKRLRKGGQV
ncbi:MAG TPA: putative molybdenum carrier protein [Acidobacteriota bacterium]|nr:putative molybdenum carrier protein [Acidobacteriota bacterium]